MQYAFRGKATLVTGTWLAWDWLPFRPMQAREPLLQ